MKIDRAIDWTWRPGLLIMDFIDFSASINLIIQLHANLKEMDHVPEAGEIDFSKIKSLKGSNINPVIENSRLAFENNRKNWMKESHEITSHKNIKPDHLLWHALKQKREYNGEITAMCYIIKKIFKTEKR